MLMLTGTNLQHAKLYNVRIVMETIRLYGPLSRVEIARRTNLTAQTVTNITRQLLKSNLIVVRDLIQNGRGAPSVLLGIKPTGAYSIGLDLDETHLTGVLMDLMGTIRQRKSVEISLPSPDEAIQLLESFTRELTALEQITLDRVWGVGVGLPGPLGVSEGGVVTNVFNPKALAGWNNVPVVSLLSQRLGIPVFLENNASAAAIGERWFGAGRHISTFFYVFFGAGLGGGLIMNGQMYPGFTGNAGELGYFPVVRTDATLRGIDRPHLGAYFNLPSLYAKLGESGVKISHPNELEQLYNEKNQILLDWIETGTDQLAPFILGIEYLIDPQAIFFGGRLPDVIIRSMVNRLQRILPALRIDARVASPELLCATAGTDAASLGVATLPLYSSFAPVPKSMEKKVKNAMATSKTNPLKAF